MFLYFLKVSFVFLILKSKPLFDFFFFFPCFILNLYTNVQNQMVLIVLVSNLNKVVQRETKKERLYTALVYFPTFVHTT